MAGPSNTPANPFEEPTEIRESVEGSFEKSAIDNTRLRTAKREESVQLIATIPRSRKAFLAGGCRCVLPHARLVYWSQPCMAWRLGASAMYGMLSEGLGRFRCLPSSITASSTSDDGSLSPFIRSITRHASRCEHIRQNMQAQT